VHGAGRSVRVPSSDKIKIGVVIELFDESRTHGAQPDNSNSVGHACSLAGWVALSRPEVE
jgi:hypothetical protein